MNNIKKEGKLEVFDEESLAEIWKLGYREKRPEWKNWDGPYFKNDYTSFETLEEFMNFTEYNFFINEKRRCIFHGDKAVGMVGRYWEDRKTLWLNIGITIYDPDSWCGGIGTAALELWIDEIFKDFPKLEHIGLTTWSGNFRMMRVAEKLGMTREAQIRKVRYWNDIYYDSISYGILRDEWNLKNIGNSTDVKILETTEQDLDNVRKLWANGDVMKFVGFQEGLKYSEEKILDWYSVIVSNRPNTNHYSIFFDNDYCGETFYSIDKNNSARLDIKIFPEYRGKGIATKALKFAIDKAFENGAKKVSVDPSPKNTKALKLYERLGFKRKDISNYCEDSEGIYMEIEK